MATPMRILAVAIGLIVFMQTAGYVYSYSACGAGTCDIKVDSFKLTVKQIIPDGVTAVKFNLTFSKDQADKEVLANEAPKTNFDCTLRFAEADIGAGAHKAASDAFDSPVKSLATFSKTSDCTLDNPKDLVNGIFSMQKKTLYGSCNVTLTSDKCSKAVFLCAECPRPTTAIYAGDKDVNNNVKCAFVKHYIHCEKGLSCYQGKGDNKSPLRCKDPNAKYCMAQRRDEGRSLFGCTSDETYCKDKTNCCVCQDMDNCNDDESCVGATFKVSIMALLVSVLVAMRFF